MGDDTNTCLQPTDGPPPLGPCDTIQQALALAQGNAGPDDVLVADGTYAENVQVGSGTALRTLDAAGPDPVIDNTPNAVAAVTILVSGGSVEGFDIVSQNRPVAINGPGSITQTDISTTAAPTTAQHISVGGVTGSVLIANNDLTDDGIGTQTGIFSNATSATNLTIRNNLISGFSQGIWLQDGDSSPLIEDNDFEGMHENNGAGVQVYEGTPVIRGNRFNSPGAGTPGAIVLGDTNGPVGATISGNTITGVPNGVAASGSSLPVTLNSDQIADGASFGLQSVDSGGGGGDVTATNVTISGNASADIYLQNSALTLDSSIVGGAITKSGSPTCAISFSRGPATGTPGDLTDCNDFQSIADPLFAGTNDYHLLAASPMIDAGNPAAPAPGALDFDGGPRALSPAPTCPARRDIGADEFVPASPGPAVCPAEATLPTPPAKKKCKKGRRLKKGKCVKKKRKRKKR